MDSRKNELYLVTVRTSSSVYESTIGAESLHRAACAGVAERCGFEVDSGAWIKRPSQNNNARRFLALESSRTSTRVTAEALTY
jgi:hypothetical protein